jgi:hypothetical protein
MPPRLFSSAEAARADALDATCAEASNIVQVDRAVSAVGK